MTNKLVRTDVYHVNVGVNKAKFLHMCHLLLKQELKLTAEIPQLALLTLQCLHFSPESPTDSLNLAQLRPGNRRD